MDRMDPHAYTKRQHMLKSAGFFFYLGSEYFISIQLDKWNIQDLAEDPMRFHKQSLTSPDTEVIDLVI